MLGRGGEERVSTWTYSCLCSTCDEVKMVKQNLNKSTESDGNTVALSNASDVVYYITETHHLTSCDQYCMNGSPHLHVIACFMCEWINSHTAHTHTHMHANTHTHTHTRVCTQAPSWLIRYQVWFNMITWLAVLVMWWVVLVMWCWWSPQVECHLLLWHVHTALCLSPCEMRWVESLWIWDHMHPAVSSGDTLTHSSELNSVQNSNIGT